MALFESVIKTDTVGTALQKIYDHAYTFHDGDDIKAAQDMIQDSSNIAEDLGTTEAIVLNWINTFPLDAREDRRHQEDAIHSIEHNVDFSDSKYRKGTSLLKQWVNDQVVRIERDLKKIGIDPDDAAVEEFVWSWHLDEMNPRMMTQRIDFLEWLDERGVL